MTSSDQHRKRMKALVAFTASSFDTEYPSPFGSAIYDERSGVLVAQAYDTVMQMCDPTNHGEINAIRVATRELQRLCLSRLYVVQHMRTLPNVHFGLRMGGN